jgi:hypothetical protein
MMSNPNPLETVLRAPRKTHKLANHFEFRPSIMSLPTHMGETNIDRIIDRWTFVGILVGCVAYGESTMMLKPTRAHS